MPPAASICHAALRSRDRRFDGVFFTGVTSTGIYCRPVCPTRAPRVANCVFFDDAAAAAQAGFRPCLRCRPELSPLRQRSAEESLAGQLLRFLRARALDGGDMPGIARAAGYSERQFRRLLMDAYGVSPVEVVQNERLLFAKRLLHDTPMSVSAVALASGFKSVRRFNASFRERLRLTPGRLRSGATVASSRGVAGGCLQLALVYRPPLAWAEMLQWLRARASRGVEAVRPDGSYARTCELGACQGWIVVRDDPAQSQLRVELSPSLAPVMAGVQQRLRSLFDLDANPAAITESWTSDSLLGPLIRRHPGLRVPGAWDVFETAVRVVLGQQVSVVAATTVAGRLAQRLGRRVETPSADLTHLAVSVAALRRAEVGELCLLGMTRRRAETLRALAEFAHQGGLEFPPTASLDAVRETLTKLPGVGPWTAEYIGLRALRFPDAFPAGDLGLRKALGRGVLFSERAARDASQRWRPWRAYAAALLWQSLKG